MEDWHWDGWLVGYDGGHALRGIAEAGRGEGGFDSPGFVNIIEDWIYCAFVNGIVDEVADGCSASNSFHWL